MLSRVVIGLPPQDDDFSGESGSDEYSSDEDRYSGLGGFGGMFGYDEDRPHRAGSDVSTDGEYERDDYPDIDRKSTAGKIGALLKDAVENVGEFTFGGVADELPSIPGLQIDGFGRVLVPLVDAKQAARLAKCGRMAPFGLGSDTVMDPKVRRTWQFDAAQVTIANKAWDRGLAQLMATVATRLGCPDMPLECHLYKLLLYGPGCHFVRHRDTEKEDRMFATLVIQLPSAHKGGELVVYQPDGTAVTHDFGAADGSAEFSQHFALHYADAEHELKTVTSGYRLALVYSICWPEGHKQIDLLQSLPAQRKFAAHLSTLASAGKSFFYIFEHQYTSASISQLKLKALKGKDRARANLIQASSRSLPDGTGYTLYIVQGTWDVHMGVDDCGSSEVFSPWIDAVTGQQYESSQRKTDLGQLINPDGKSRTDLWAVEKRRVSTKYTGNEGYQIHNRYNCYLLVGIPDSLGPYGLLQYLGHSSISQLVDLNTCTSADLNQLLTSLPSSLKETKPIPDYLLCKEDFDISPPTWGVPTTKDDLPARLLSVIVSRLFIDCIPTFFDVMPDPLSAAMIPLYLQAMKISSAAASTSANSTSASLWPTIRPLLIANIWKSQQPFMFGLKLVCDAVVAKIRQDVWLPLLQVVGTLPAPADAFRSMRSILLRTAKVKPMWCCVGKAVVVSLHEALKGGNQGIRSSYGTMPVCDAIRKLATRLAVMAAQAGVGKRELKALVGVINTCVQVKQSWSWRDCFAGEGFEDSFKDIKIAVSIPDLWQYLVPSVCSWLAHVQFRRIARGVELVLDVFKWHESESIPDDLWLPVLDAATVHTGFLETGREYFSSYGPSYETVAADVVDVMRHPDIWDTVALRVGNEVERHQERSRFSLGLSILKAAQKDSTIPLSHWSPFVPIVFACAFRPSLRQSKNDELAFWSIVTVDPADLNVIDRVVASYIAEEQPQHLDTTVAAIITLLALHPSTLDPQPFTPLLRARLAWLQAAIPSAPPAATPTASNSSWVIPNASFPSDARIDQFLKTNEPSIRFAGFAGIAAARAWAKDHQPPTAVLSRRLVVEAGGVGKRAYVEVRKVRAPLADSGGGSQVGGTVGSADGREANKLIREWSKLVQALRFIQAGQPVPKAYA